MAIPTLVVFSPTSEDINSALGLVQALTLDVIPGQQISLAPSAAPTKPSAGFILYVDQTDLKLKAISSGGTITTLANA